MRNQLSPSKPLRTRLSDLVLTVLAIAGTICLILVIVGLTMNVSIMMFRTGSMEPTISTGSIALVREIPATEMSEGDIVTVDRGENVLPVTHRVREITEIDEASGAVTFVMRGDANDVDDPEPYTAETVRRVFFSAPGVAPVIQWFQNPLVLGGLTISATILVVWAFWPREHESPQPKQGAHRSRSIALPVVLALAVPFVASDQTTTTDVYGDYLRLRSSGDTEKMTNMAPGDSATWVVDVWVDAPEPGEIDLDLSASGQLASQRGALTTNIVVCSPHPTEITACSEGSEAQPQRVDTTQLAINNEEYSLGTMPSDQARRVLVTATIADPPPDAMQETSVAFRFTATGEDEQLTVTPDPEKPDISPVPDDKSSDEPDLANTGFGTQLWLFILAALLVLSGSVTLIAHNRKRRHRFRQDSQGD